MKPLRPFFTFYGGKWRAAAHYPTPEHETVVEPFAGSAGYSLRHFSRRITLVERDPAIAATWRYLLRVSEKEVLGLPDIEMDQTTDDLGVCDEARMLIGWWLKGGSREPVRKPTGWMRKSMVPGYKNGGRKSWWSSNIRERIASQLKCIRHWTLIEGDYTSAPDIEATWFIDPPYNNSAGAHYRYGSGRIDYEALSRWCLSRRGTTIVCEQVGANWLPFQPWREVRSSTNQGVAKRSKEAIFLQRKIQT